MDDAERRVRKAMQDARSDSGRAAYEDMMWDGDMLVPRKYESSLDKETLDERNTSRMGEQWEETRRGADE